MTFKDKCILVTGGTGSLGRRLVARVLNDEMGLPSKVRVFSRDEAKQHQMRLEWKQKEVATDEIIYRNVSDILEFQIGDVRDLHAVVKAVKGVDFVVNAAALKQVPTCEYFPYEAVQTNIIGAYNIAFAVTNYETSVDTVVGVSTDKACKPVNVMGMTKSIQERIFIEANRRRPTTRFTCVRYGNVLASRGSVIPLFLAQIRRGGPVTITTKEMTRFLLTLDQAVDTIFAAIGEARRGETYIPKVTSARIMDIVNVLIGNREIERRFIGIRPGEKVHEILISEEECFRTVMRGDYFVIQPILPELRQAECDEPLLEHEYTSADNLVSLSELKDLLKGQKLLVEDYPGLEGELLR